MADELENHTLHLLREMREENAAFREEVRLGFQAVNGRLEKLETAVAGLKTDVAELKKDVAELQVGLAATRVDVAAIKTNVEAIRETQQNHGARLNAMEGRLAIIERQTGLVKA